MTITTDLLTTEPTVKHKQNDRTIVYEWNAGRGADMDGKPATMFVTLTCSHYSSKTFSATLRRECEPDREPGDIFSVRSYWAMELVRIVSEPVARYSAKALASFAVGALAALRDNLDNPKVAELVGAAGQAGLRGASADSGSTTTA